MQLSTEFQSYLEDVFYSKDTSVGGKTDREHRVCEEHGLCCGVVNRVEIQV